VLGLGSAAAAGGPSPTGCVLRQTRLRVKTWENCLRRNGQTIMARSTRLVMLIKNIYNLWDRERLLPCVANF